LSAASYIAQASGNADTDRLIGYDTIPREVPEADVTAIDDIFDAQNSPIAQQFDQMMQTSAQQHRQQLVSQLADPAPSAPAPAATSRASSQPPNDYWFMHQTPAAGQAQNGSGVMFADPQVVQPGVTQNSGLPQPATPAEEQALADALKSQADAQTASYSHLKTINPAGAPKPIPDAVTQDLARNNDLDVATLARQAKKAREPKLPPDDEVVIPLH
jgi:hypothetical protein